MKDITIGIVSPFLPLKDGIAIYSNNLISHMDMDGIRIFTIGSPGSKADIHIPLDSLSLHHKLGNIIREEKIDVLHIQHVPTLFGKYTLNLNVIKAVSQDIPTIVTLHEVHYTKDHLRDKVLSWIESSLANKATKTIVHSHKQKHFLEKNAAKGKVECIYHGLNLHMLNTHNEKRQLLFFGYITPLKGIEQLIKAMEFLPDCELTIAGHVPQGVDQDYKNELNAQIRRAELTGRITTLFRWISEEEKDRLFREASIVCLPYLWGPYQSGILHNAMSYGIPVIVSDVGSLHEMAEEFKIGEIIKPKDVAGIAQAVLAILKHHDLYEHGIAHYREKANWNVIADQHKRLYQSL